MQEEVIGIGKRHPASLNRFVYYPDHLVRMPGPYPSANTVTNIFKNARTLLSEPIFSGALSGLAAEPTVALRRPNVQDESVGDFLRRRFGQTITDNLVSALFHGIYAGDLYKLSARTLLPQAWYLETRDPDGSGVMMEMADLFLRRVGLFPYHSLRFRNMTMVAKDGFDALNDPKSLFLVEGLMTTSVYTFVHGLGVLARRLETALRSNPNVTIKTSSKVSKVEFRTERERVSIDTDGASAADEYDYVVSSLRPGMVQQFRHTSMTSRKATADPAVDKACDHVDHAVSVMVVNLYYSNPHLIPRSLAGFGYLLPRSVPLDQNPERALGVIFGSETSGLRGSEARQTIPLPSAEQVEAIRQTMTQHEEFLAGLRREVETDVDQRKNDPKIQELIHMEEKKAANNRKTWDELQNMMKNKVPRIVAAGQDTAPGTKLTVMLGGHWWDSWTESDLPGEDQAIEMAKSVLARHLHITEAPVVAKARLNRDAIPQYPVHYRQAMATIHRGLLDEYQGRFKVAGTWWQGGVGVNDCVRKARETAFAIREGWDDRTGLEEYTENEKWCLIDRRTGQAMMDPMCR